MVHLICHQKCYSFFTIIFQQAFLYVNDSDDFAEMVTSPIYSEIIGCKDAHKKLWIDDSYPIIATDEGNVHKLLYQMSIANLTWIKKISTLFKINFYVLGIDDREPKFILCEGITKSGDEQNNSTLSLVFEFKNEIGE